MRYFQLQSITPDLQPPESEKGDRIRANALAFEQRGGWLTQHTKLTPIFTNWKELGDKKKKDFTQPHTFHKHDSADTQKRAALREKHVVCNNGRTKITNEGNKYSNHETGHETGSAGQSHAVFQVFWLPRISVL